MERLISQVAQLVVPGAVSEQTTDNSGYAPTYFPGVIAASEAGRVKLAPSQEIGGIDFSIQVVPFATVRGLVAGGTGTVMLVSDASVAAAGGRGGGGRGGLEAIRGALLGGPNLRTETQADGSFTIRNVTPGKYTIIARVDGGSGDPKMAIQSLTVAGEEMTVMLSPVSGVDVSGTITLEASASNVPKGLSGFRVNLAPADSAAAGGPRRPSSRPGGERALHPARCLPRSFRDTRRFAGRLDR